MDAVYVVRAGNRNEELRFSLRSLANVADIERVWIVGHCPPWVNANHIPVHQGPDKFLNVKAALHAAVTHPDVSERFAYFNDDFFVMQPMDTLPVLHRGRVRDVIAAHRLPTPNTVALKDTADLLAARGIPDPLCYDLHAPMTVTKAGLAAALAIASPRMVERTLYGNLERIGGERAHNFKVYDTDPAKWDGWPFLSTLDSTFRSHPVGAHIRATFPHPSEYER